MTNSAQTALQKIIDAFGKAPKTLTRIQIFAKIARVTNDIAEKRLYPDIAEAQRKDVLENLKKYFLFYRAEEYLLSDTLFYPRALTYWAQRKILPFTISEKSVSRTTDKLIHKISKIKGFTSIFDSCRHEIAQNMDAYSSRTMHSLIDDFQGASHIQVPKLRLFFRYLTGYTTHNTGQLLFQLSRFAHEHDVDEVTAAIADKYHPSSGPDTPEELYFELVILYNHAFHPLIPKTPGFHSMMDSFKKLIDLSRFLCRDIPKKNLDDQLRVLLSEGPLAKLARFQILSVESVSGALAMARYYSERHRDKFSPDIQIDLTEKIAGLYVASFFHDHDANERKGRHRFTDLEKASLILKMLDETWSEWEKPSVAEMIQSIDKRLKHKNKIKFYNLLDDAEPYFDLHVSFYAEQNETMRKLRRNLFKNGSIGTDDDGHRATFLKHLADDRTSELISAGLSRHDVDFMSRTGKLLPTNTTWNVDHVIDIHAGGTNNVENLCLMSSSLNQMKNAFLLLQTAPHADAKEGFWILTLRPKPGVHGEPRRVLKEISQPPPASSTLEIKGPT